MATNSPQALTRIEPLWNNVLMIVPPVRNSEEARLQERSSSSRLFQLDSLRGLAAFCVIWYHLRLAFPSARSHNPFLVVLTSGHEAVVLFFVLSGYVLGMPLWAGRQRPYGSYLLRRFCRIYVPYFAAMMFAWVCARHFFGSTLTLTPWFHLTWQTPLLWGLFVREVFMSTTPAVNTAFWSLRLEAEFSILLPVFCWLVLRLRAAGVAVLCVASYVLGTRVHNEDAVLRLMYYPMFFLGLLLSFYAEPLAGWWKRLPRLAHGVLLTLGVGLYLHVLPLAPQPADALTEIGSCLLILCALQSSRIAGVLRHRVAEYLGRISYSLYLVHGTVLFVALNLLYEHVPFPLLIAIYGVCALVLAHLFYVIIERPALQLGRKLTTRKATDEVTTSENA